MGKKIEMKERDTTIVRVRIKKDLLIKVDEKVPTSKQPSRNAWINQAIRNGLRSHRGNGK